MADKGREAERRRLAAALRDNLKRRKAAAKPVSRERQGDNAPADRTPPDETTTPPTDGGRG